MPEHEPERLRVEPDGEIATVWLSRPPVNATDLRMFEAIHALFAQPERIGPDVRAIVLAGEGRHFCAGGDLEEFESLTPENARTRAFAAREAFWALRDCRMPVIAAVGGAALGAGLTIAASCDVVVAAEDARLGLPEITVGVMGGAAHLGRLVPQGVVRSMFLTGEPLPAPALARYGGIARIAAPGEQLDDARAVARRIARHSPIALATAKHSLNSIESRSLKAGYEFEQGLTRRLSGHPDAKEALRAFRERRPARFSGSTA